MKNVLAILGMIIAVCMFAVICNNPECPPCPKEKIIIQHDTVMKTQSYYNDLPLIGRSFYVGTFKCVCTELIILESGKILIGSEDKAFVREICDFVVASIKK